MGVGEKSKFISVDNGGKKAIIEECPELNLATSKYKAGCRTIRASRWVPLHSSATGTLIIDAESVAIGVVVRGSEGNWDGWLGGFPGRHLIQMWVEGEKGKLQFNRRPMPNLPKFTRKDAKDNLTYYFEVRVTFRKGVVTFHNVGTDKKINCQFHEFTLPEECEEVALAVS